MFGERLKSARKMAGYSLEELANKLGDITKQALSNYENNKRNPDSAIIIRLAKIFGVKPDYFLRNSNVKFENFEYRKRSKILKKEINRIEEKTIDYLERFIELEQIMGFDEKFVNPLKNIEISDGRGAETAAEKLREEWRLGLNPIKNLIETLEEKEIRIFEIDADKGFDGLAVYSGAIPIIIVNKDIDDIVRKRMTIAHELGHLLLKLNSKLNSKEKERFCYRFAGAFLIPKQVMTNGLGENRTKVILSELEHLKLEYGISILALMRRARDLGIITSQKYRNFCIRVKKEGWGKFEVGKYEAEEKPIRDKHLLYRALAEEIISASKAASIANITVSELENEVELVV
ncbi:MAG: XRE family transcriptional regulator [Ignavibacteriaceae bacterium]|nr:XRE family transcriptional regulator [Ignavibacteriaceae bacterium]